MFWNSNCWHWHIHRGSKKDRWAIPYCLHGALNVHIMLGRLQYITITAVAIELLTDYKRSSVPSKILRLTWYGYKNLMSETCCQNVGVGSIWTLLEPRILEPGFSIGSFRDLASDSLLDCVHTWYLQFLTICITVHYCFLSHFFLVMIPVLWRLKLR